MAHNHLTWVEIDKGALRQNLATFRSVVGPQVSLLAVVKANAYGHGASIVAGVIQETRQADWLGVHSLDEAAGLRAAGVRLPILVLGYVPLARLREVVRHRLRITVTNPATIAALSKLKPRRKQPVHIKLETGTHRLGLDLEQAASLAAMIQRSKVCSLEGFSTHFANIEDTTDHGYALGQLSKYEKMVSALGDRGFKVPVIHAACTAAALILPQTHQNLVRLGIGMYGLWPSRETLVSIRERNLRIKLRPVAAWKTRVAQVKTIPAGASVGYGCTYRTTRKSRLAILPIGYSDGFARAAGSAHVLIRGHRAPIRGRICMNLCMADVTDIRGAEIEDEVVLLGNQGKDSISAEQLAAWSGTIHYEVISRINPLLPRVVV